MNIAARTSPGRMPAKEQLDDAFVDRHAVDDQRQRGRDHQAQRRRACQRADDHVFGVFAFAQFGDRHLAHGGQRRCRRARNGGEHRAADDIGVHQPARQPRHPGREARNMSSAKPGSIQDLAHPDEHRQRGQRPAGRGAPDVVSHHVAHGPGGEQLHPNPGNAHQGQADPDAGAQKQEQDEKEQDDDIGLPYRLLRVLSVDDRAVMRWLPVTRRVTGDRSARWPE